MSTKRTPLYEKHLEAGAQMVDYGGWEMPISYTSLADEHHAVRQRSGLFDVSHMGEIFVQGPQATQYVNSVFSNNIDHLDDGQILYGFLLNPQGGVIDDLLVYKVNHDYYILVVNAANTDKDYKWLLAQAEKFDVTLDNNSDEIALLAIQGPKAQDILQSLVSMDLEDIGFFRFIDDIPLAGTKAMISRTGYTGENGFEIFVPSGDAVALWDALVIAGAENLSFAGLGARDTLRFEAGLPLYGNEFDDSITPLEAGFGYFVSKTNDYVGSDVMAAMREHGVPRNLVGLEIEGRAPARHGYPVYNLEGEEIGVVTTGYRSPTLDKGIANALVNLKDRSVGTQVLIGVRNKKVPARIIPKQFLKKNTKEKSNE